MKIILKNHEEKIEAEIKKASRLSMILKCQNYKREKQLINLSILFSLKAQDAGI